MRNKYLDTLDDPDFEIALVSVPSGTRRSWRAMNTIVSGYRT